MSQRKFSVVDRLLPQNYIPQLKDLGKQAHKVLHSVTTAALRALPQDAVQEMDKALQLNSINVSKWQASMIVIQVLSFVIEHELLYTYVYQNDPDNADNYTANPYDFPIFPWLLVFEIVFFGSTCLSVYFAIQYHIVKTDKAILDHQTGDIKKRLLFEPIPGWWNVFRHALPEMILLMVQIPPGIKSSFSMPAYNGEMVTYSVRIFNCVCFLRLYLFVRLLKNTSSLHAEDLSIVSDLRKTTDLEESKLLYIKSVVHQHTTTICFFCVMGGITIFAYLILIFERTTVQSTSNYPDRWMQKFGYAECWWFVWTVYTTVGFGDWTPVTPFGRIMSVFSSVIGLMLTALLISSTEAEEKLFEKMQNSKFMRKQRKEAVCFVWNWYSYHKHRVSTMDMLRARDRWVQFQMTKPPPSLHVEDDLLQEIIKVKEQQSLMFAMLDRMASGAPASRSAASAHSPRRQSFSKGDKLASAALGAAASQRPPERKVVPVQAPKRAAVANPESERHNAGDIELQDA